MGRSEKCNIGWMASYNNPTPIEFFHLLSSSHKSSAFGKYNVLLSQAIKCCEDPVKQLELEKIKETADCHADWNVWLIERKEGLIHNEVHETNVKVHRELNTFVRNSGKQKSNDNANGETEEGSNSNNINVNYEEEKGSNSNSTNADNKKRKIIIHYILNDILLASQAEKDNLDIYCSKFSHCSVMDLWLNSEFSLFLDQELQERILHEVFDTIDNDYVTDEIHNFFSDFFNADHGKEGWMASYNNPTPIEFFHLLSSSHKSSAFGKYNVLLSQAIKCCEDPVKQLELEKIKETADCHADWNVWLIERKEGLIHNEVHETNVKVHRELNTFVRNSGKQKNYFTDQSRLKIVTDKVSERVYKSLDERQIEWLDKVLKQKSWIQTDEFKKYVNQFTEDVCDRVTIPCIVCKPNHIDTTLVEDTPEKKKNVENKPSSPKSPSGGGSFSPLI
ncbi:3112_t:CDS:10 [Entrophospora sp. SA101]|nr:3112_t:CDS:10 [Entrophospora sp. SA101]